MSTARPERVGPPHGVRDPADAAPRRVFALGCIVLFVGCTAVTIGRGVSTSAMAALPMRGGWSLSMHWLAMCGRNAPTQMADWLGMWSAMTVAMMLPAAAPNLWRYRCAAAHAGASRPMALAACVGGGYLLVWIGLGAMISVTGTALAAGLLERPTLARATPLAMGVVLMLAGALQCTACKARQLAHCRHWPAGVDVLPSHSFRAWRAGLRLGCLCVASCAGPTAILLVGGVMNLRVMAVVTAAITAERLSFRGDRVARAIGVLALVAGLWRMIVAITAAV
jgi:predicted metal-binding membrane protein